MQIKNILPALLVLVFSLSSWAQTPHLSGKVEVKMATGQITCDFILSNIPDLGNDYQILLNKGFNIKAIKDAEGNTLRYDGFYNGKMKGEGLTYTPKIKDSVYRNPKQLQISYTGAFPIYNDSFNFIDFKGLIAFNGQTLRATDQSKWYPVIYDVKNDRLLEQPTYDITVSTNLESTIFVNGDLPKKGPTARFTSTIPVAPLLFVGKYPIQQTNSAWFLNTKMNKKQLGIFEQNIAEMKRYYNKVLAIPYDTKNVFIEHSPIEKFNNGRSWGFVTFPTIAFAGISMGNMIDEKNNKLKDSTDYPFIAHEIAHYYFGNVLQPNATLMWFFLESTAEYLSVKASEEKFGKGFGAAYFKAATSNLKNYKVIPLPAIKDMNQIDANYRYKYGPLLLRGMEQMIGEKRTFDFLKTCLAANKELTDYAFFKRNALKSGITAQEWASYEKDYLLSENVTALIRY